MSGFSQSKSLKHILTEANVTEMSSALVSPEISPRYISITSVPLHFKCDYIHHSLSEFTAGYVLVA